MRNGNGLTLVETLVSTTVMSFVAVCMMSILLVNYRTSAKLTAMQDNIDAVRQIKERLSSDVREGRALGDVFGQLKVNNTVSPALTYTVGSDRFPEATRNPIYGGTVPFTPAMWPAAPWKLGNQCLIVQVPVLDNHADSGGGHAVDSTKIGWPTMIPAGWKANGPASTVNQDNVETHVYMIVPDPDNAGEFLMQVATFGGMPVPGYSQNAHTRKAQTILKGIVGPLDGNGTPKVFQFINRVKADGVPDDAILPDGTHSPEYTGVVVNLEVRRHQMQNAKRANVSQPPIGMKLEVFLRNNALATSVGQPVGTGP
jgi:hypothetical protein